MLARYWITFKEREDLIHYGGIRGFGVGVTAYDIVDAKRLMVEKIFKEQGLPEIKSVIENIRYDDLERNHVQKNMGVIVKRGIWFPLGFE